MHRTYILCSLMILYIGYTHSAHLFHISVTVNIRESEEGTIFKKQRKRKSIKIYSMSRHWQITVLTLTLMILKTVHNTSDKHWTRYHMQFNLQFFMHFNVLLNCFCLVWGPPERDHRYVDCLEQHPESCSSRYCWSGVNCWCWCFHF